MPPMLSSGYTLTELLLVLALILISATFITFDQTSWRDARLAREQTTQLLSVFQFARYQSLLQQSTVTVCPTTNGEQCGSHWADGQIVFLGNLAARKALSPDAILRVIQSPEPRGFWQHPAGQSAVQFTPVGLLQQGQNGTFTYCARDNPQAHAQPALVLSLTGRVRLTTISTTCR